MMQQARHPNSLEVATNAKPCFASRMIQLLFHKRRSAAEPPNSWPVRQEPVPVPAPPNLQSTPSASIIIPSGLSSSAPSTVPAQHIRLYRPRRQHKANGASEHDWRGLQAHCANCERLFFKALSDAGRFCSLDCKTNFEFVSQFNNLVDEQMLGLVDCSVSFGT